MLFVFELIRRSVLTFLPQTSASMLLKLLFPVSSPASAFAVPPRFPFEGARVPLDEFYAPPHFQFDNVLLLFAARVPYLTSPVETVLSYLKLLYVVLLIQLVS